jgi:lysophospholipase L1-like esterase
MPLPRTDANSLKAHDALLEKRTRGQIDIYFEGDSITRRWGASDTQYADSYANWKQNFWGWNAADFGWGGDKTQNMLWRLKAGEMDGVKPKVIVLMAGTNNIGRQSPLNDADAAARAAAVVGGIRALVADLRQRAPQATLVITGITPRNDNIAVMPIINAANVEIAKWADGKTVRYVNINRGLADEDDVLKPGMMNDGLHLTPQAYQVWADALKPIFTELLGAPAAEDRAPPPTADPSAKRP